jgi:hypothetical protein
MPAFTLGGTVSGGGNQINNVVIGTSTPLAGAFTTLSATKAAAGDVVTWKDNVSGNTGFLYADATNLVIGRSANASAGGLFVSAASTTLYGPDQTKSAAVSNTGLAVTGALSATTTGTFGDHIVFNNPSSGSIGAAGQRWLGSNGSGTGVFLNAITGGTIALGINNTAVATTSSTGLAVTGTLSSTLGATIQGLTVGLGAGAVSTNTAVGASALAANTTGYNNAAFGQTALTTNTTGYQNTAVGRQALYTNLDGINNTGLGMNALVGNTSGSYNTAVGQAALQANTTASNNTAVGYQAGYTLSAVANQTFLGYQAGYSRSTGDDNYSTVMVGNLAGYSTSTGIDNTYMGGYAARFQTGSSNTAIGGGSLYGASGTSTGSNNTAVGYNAGLNNTSGAQNTAVGGASSQFNTTGTFNTALGFGAYAASTSTATGSYNTALGAQSLINNTTASNNTAVGYQAGYNGTVAGNSVVLGYQAGFTNIRGSSNTLLGYQAGYLMNPATAINTINTFVGYGAGYSILTGTKNTIIGAYSGNQGGLDIQNASNYIVLSDGDGNPLISTNSARSVALNGAVPQTGTGITFPATQSASSNANTLDDYEEGTFTPVLQFGGASVGITYIQQRGTYTKIGNTVTIQFGIYLSSKGSSVGSAIVAGLPFTSKNQSFGSYGGSALFGTSGFTAVVGETYGVVSENSTLVYLYIQSNGTESQLTSTNFANGTYFQFSTTYQID